MKLKKLFDYNTKPHTYTVAEAVAHSLEPYDGGELEGMRRKTDNCAQMLGQLVDMLYENKHLTKSQILQLVSNYEEVD